MGNTRPGAVRHSSRQAAHRARVRASHFGPRETTATPQHGSRASAVIHAYPATALHAWGTVSPPICHVRAPETCPSEACEREKKDCQGKSEGEGGRLGGEGALNSPPPDHRRGECLVTIRRKMNSYSWILVAHDVGVRVERDKLARRGSP